MLLQDGPEGGFGSVRCKQRIYLHIAVAIAAIRSFFEVVQKTVALVQASKTLSPVIIGAGNRSV